MPVRTDIAMMAERIIVFMIVLLESLVHTVAGLGARSADVGHVASANRCRHAAVRNIDHARLKKAPGSNRRLRGFRSSSREPLPTDM
jgi:hypothetical protein